MIEGQNIATQTGGDNILARIWGSNDAVTVKGGEMILTDQQQRNAELIGGADFFRKIGVPGLNTGGVVGSISQSAISQSISSFGLWPTQHRSFFLFRLYFTSTIFHQMWGPIVLSLVALLFLHYHMWSWPSHVSGGHCLVYLYQREQERRGAQKGNRDDDWTY